MAENTAEDYMRFFHEVDVNGDGNLTLEELTLALKKKGHREQQIRGYFNSMDTSCDGLVSVKEFQQAMGCVPPEVTKGATMRMIFREFDRDGNGTIDKTELEKMFLEMGKHFSEKELTRMIELMDGDGDGLVDYEEFIKHFTGNKGAM